MVFYCSNGCFCVFWWDFWCNLKACRDSFHPRKPFSFYSLKIKSFTLYQVLMGETIITIASVITAIGVIFGVIFAVYKWYLKQENFSCILSKYLLFISASANNFLSIILPALGALFSEAPPKAVLPCIRPLSNLHTQNPPMRIFYFRWPHVAFFDSHKGV